jgi:catechol 2,3-dioxygenase-like lactoylglutathione lyase family enzyme
MMLHFRDFHERRGIGRRITEASHMAITCTDIGVSAAFYSDVLGLPQIERPNFDRFGAWFTCGNIELHLIKGQAFVPSGEDLIVPHLAIETDDVDACMKKLDEMDPPIEYQTNVSVVTDDERGIVKQIFVRDPDGYYIEIGISHVLTKFCLGHKKYDAFADK